MKKVYTATLFLRNYGSALQAFALHNMLRELGADPILIKRPAVKIGKLSLLSRLKIFLRPEKHYGILKKIRRWFQKKHVVVKNRKIEKFMSENTKIESLSVSIEGMKDGDSIFLCGSDQVWNIIDHDIYDYYLLNYEQARKDIEKYSFAASTGTTSFTPEQIKYYNNVLSDFRVLSLREKGAYNIFSKEIDHDNIRWDMDPTLLYGKEFWDKITHRPAQEKPYVFVYMLRPNNDLIKMAREVAKKDNLNIIYMGNFVNYYKGVITIKDAGIEEYLSYIKYASKVITNSFHGTVFSLLFEKPFVSVYVESTSSRAENILEITGLTNRLISTSQELGIIDSPIDYDLVRERLDNKRKESTAYLESIIQS